MADFERAPSELSFNGNVSENWKRWKQKLLLYLDATDKADKPDKTKIAILLHLIGDEGLEIFNTFQFANEEDEKKFAEVVKKFDEYCTPRTNIVFERFKFFSRGQLENEAFDHFLTDVKKLAASCDFGTQAESLIRDRVVLGIYDKTVQERLLRLPDLSLKAASDHCRAAEASRDQARALLKPNGLAVEGLTSHGRSSKPQNVQHKKSSGVENAQKCSRCNIRHLKGRCPAYGKTCLKCKKLNHFASVCKSVNSLELSTSRDEGGKSQPMPTCDQGVSDNNEYYIDSVHTFKVDPKQWIEEVDIEGCNIKMKLDTGAEVSTLPSSVALQIQGTGRIISHTDVTLVAWGGTNIKPVGKMTLWVKRLKPNAPRKQVEFVIVNTDNVMPLLGLQAVLDLGMVKRLDHIHLKNENRPTCVGLSRQEIVNQNTELFEGLGKLPGRYKIELKNDAHPVIKPSRRIPIALRDKLKGAIDRLINQGVISAVNKPTEWVHNLVIIEKQDGKLRLCLDPKELNLCIKREHYEIPAPDEIVSRLAGKKVFSVLDMKDGFYQIVMDDKSSDLCTFSTPFGRYKFLRMPFGIASAPEVFQKKNVQMFGDIKGVEIYIDDIIIAGETEVEHDRALNEVLKRAKQHGVRFNKSKFQYKVETVKFVGNVLSAEGISPDEDNIKAILEMKTPASKVELLRFLGMINYLGKYIPNLSTKTASLRELLKQNTEWIWSKQHDEAIQKLKRCVTNPPVLRVYDSTLPVTLQVDASMEGMGACLMQMGQPIAFASRSFTECEKRYAQIEKEFLAIVFGTQKFHYYIYGRFTTVHTDHKPLEAIVLKNINEISSRLQRMMLKIVKYNLKVQYVPGKLLFVADTLSRAALDTTGEVDPDLNVLVHAVEKYLPISEARKQQFKLVIAKDPVLSLVTKYVLSGWPDKTKLPDVRLKLYQAMQVDLQVIDGLLFLNDKLVVPKGLQGEMLEKLHEAHLGIVKTKARARQVLYWPGMSSDIENMIQKCRVCEKFQSAVQKEPLLTSKIPQRPWEMIGVDLMDYGGKTYLVVMDYYSKWLEIIHLDRGKTSFHVLDKMKNIFSIHGIPEVVRSDNMPFNSFQFRSFSQQWDFELITSSPHYPKSNGLAEKAVGIAKNLLRKCTEEGRDLSLVLLDYRNTPVCNSNVSPAQLLMSRMLRTRIPTINVKLNPQIQAHVADEIKRKQLQQQVYYNSSSKVRPAFNPNDNVVIRSANKQWVPGRVIRTHTAPRSYIVQDERGSIVRRNSNHLRTSLNEPCIVSHDMLNEDNCTSIQCPAVTPRENPVDTNVTENNLDNSVIKSKFGRIVRKPKYLSNYVV